MCIISDTCKKMNVDTILMFQIWEVCGGFPAGEGDRQHSRWTLTKKISDDVEKFCLDILIDKTLLIETEEKPYIRLRKTKKKE